MSAALDSRMVAWWPVWTFVNLIAQQYKGDIPAAGTPAWCALADDDPRKLLACAIEGVHHVLRVEIAQEQRAEASKAVAAAADWSAIARELQQRDAARKSGARIERRTDV